MSLKLEFPLENRTHRAEKPNVEVTVGLGPMPPDASDFPGGIPALGALHVCEIGVVSLVWTMQEIILNRNQVSGDILLLAALVKPV